MPRRVVCISRFVGAGGEEVGRRVAEALDYRLVDEEILQQAAESSGVIGPDLTHFASRKRFAGSLMESTPDNIAKWIENPDHMKPGALMPNLGMTGEQSKAIAAYLLSLK